MEAARHRPAAVAGAFYEGSQAQLRGDVRALLADAMRREASAGPPPKALIVPHAGYVYSGPVAASAYAALHDVASRIERVVLFGPAHRVPLRGLAAPGVAAFDTPLGSVPLDREAIASAAELPQVVVDDRPHAPEHSLEVQLPFLQEVLGDFALAPFVVGDASPREVAEVMERLWGGPETLLVVSSDLSHYYDYATARRLDAETTRAIVELDPHALDAESACGRVPIRGLLVAARRRGLRVDVLDVRSSGDTAGPRDRVVGYGAYALCERPVARAEDDDAEALALAHRAVRHAVHEGRALPIDHEALAPGLQREGACFVTLHKNGELRGCMGELEAKRPLAHSIVESARNAALRDPRFAPVEPAELPEIRLEVSLLGAPRPLDVRSRHQLLAALQPGVDGVVLGEGKRRATFLPAVWQKLATPEAFVSALERKAGLAPAWTPERRAWTYRVRELA